MKKIYHPSWDSVLTPLFETNYMRQLSFFLDAERANFDIFPPEDLVFNAMLLTPFEDIKVVILGQDPYHNFGQAHGLSFSVRSGVPLPPSLKNIFTELSADIHGFTHPSTGDLSSWSRQGVLLLNAILTVRAHEAGSHQKMGWETFTDSIIEQISERLDHVVFILWGSYAQKKKSLIDAKKHFVLTSAHPSPLSVYRGFWGSKPFSRANDYLIEHGRTPVDWTLHR